jgi:hypothetical protein
LTPTFAPHQSGSTLKIRADMFAAKEAWPPPERTILR